MNGCPTLLPGLAQPLIYTSRQIVAGNRPETDPFSVILFRGPGCKELPLISAAALNLKKCASCYGFLREQNQGYRNAAIGFKGSDKPDLPSCGPLIFFSLVDRRGPSRDIKTCRYRLFKNEEQK